MVEGTESPSSDDIILRLELAQNKGVKQKLARTINKIKKRQKLLGGVEDNIQLKSENQAKLLVLGSIPKLREK